MLCHTLMMMALPTKAPLERPTAVGSVDSTERPVRCHWERAEHSGLCDEAIAGIEAAWSLQVDGLGWPEPLEDEDGILDVYVSSDGEGGAYAYGPWEDVDPSDGRLGTYAYIVIDPEFETWFYWTMLHEFNHVLQYAIDVTESKYVAWEGTATAAESWSDPDLLPLDDYIQHFQATPWVGLMGDGWMLWEEHEIWSYYEYGATLWLFHLDETTGDGAGSAGLDLWLNNAQDSWENEPDFLDAAGVATGSWEEGWMGFTIDRVAVGTSATPEWAATYGGAQFAIGVEASLTAADLPATVTPEFMPLQTGAVYAEITDLAPGTSVVVSADGDEGVRWAVFAADGSAGDWVEGGELEWTVDGDSVFVGVVNLGSEGFDSDELAAASSVNIEISIGDGTADDEKSGGCACSASRVSGSTGLWFLVASVLAGFRRRD